MGGICIFHVVELALVPIKTIFCQADQYAGLSKLMPSGFYRMGSLNRIHAGSSIAVLKVVGFTCDLTHTFQVIVRTIEVLQAFFGFMPVTLHQVAIVHFISNGDTRNCCVVCTVNTSASCPAEQIPVFANSLPAGSQFTVLGVVDLAILLEHSTISGLTYVNTGLAKVVVQTVNLLNTQVLFAVFVVGEATVLIHPAILQCLDQSIGILEGVVNATKDTALISIIIRIDIGIQSIDFLVLGLLCERVQTACAQIDLIADLAGIDHGQLRLIAPRCILLGC